MAVMQVYQHGVTCGVPGNNRGQGGMRGTVQGWSHQASKNNVKFLRSITLDQLTGHGYTFTLTLKRCPETSDQWHKMRRAFLMRLERMGLIRLHWVTEWQRRGVPHLHGIAYFPPDSEIDYLTAIPSAWLAVAHDHCAMQSGQHIAMIFSTLGWLKYLAKHSARGISHYQRCPENIPPAWQKKTGRVWGHTGQWPIEAPLRLTLCREGFNRYRRMVRNWRLADARLAGSGRRIRQARQMLQDKDRARSELRGVSEWVPQDLSLRMVEGLAAMGYAVES